MILPQDEKRNNKMTDDVARAMEACAKVHAGQKDKAGMPYVMHPMRVAANFTDPQLVIIAFLHDVLEDSTGITPEDIHNAFGGDILNTILTLTRTEGEDYFDYIERISEDPNAVKVKLADLRDNMNIIRLNFIATKDTERLNKYMTAYKILNS